MKREDVSNLVHENTQKQNRTKTNISNAEEEEKLLKTLFSGMYCK